MAAVKPSAPGNAAAWARPPIMIVLAATAVIVARLKINLRIGFLRCCTSGGREIDKLHAIRIMREVNFYNAFAREYSFT
jgi:hypothetical protein